jgi:hypothetical protein
MSHGQDAHAALLQVVERILFVAPDAGDQGAQLGVLSGLTGVVLSDHAERAVEEAGEDATRTSKRPVSEILAASAASPNLRQVGSRVEVERLCLETFAHEIGDDISHLALVRPCEVALNASWLAAVEAGRVVIILARNAGDKVDDLLVPLGSKVVHDQVYQAGKGTTSDKGRQTAPTPGRTALTHLWLLVREAAVRERRYCLCEKDETTAEGMTISGVSTS